MRFEIPESSGERAQWTHKSIFRGLLRWVPLPLARVAKLMGMSTETMNSYSSPLNQTRPKSETISKMIELVSDHVDEVIAISRALEAENPLTEAEFMHTALARMPEWLRWMATATWQGFEFADGLCPWVRLSSTETAGERSGTRHWPRTRPSTYLRALKDSKPVVIDGEPLSDDPRLRKKMLLSWAVKGLNILAKSMGLHRVTIDSWLGHGYKVAPPATVVNDLVRLYSSRAVDARDEIDAGRFDITIPATSKQDLRI